MANDTQLPAPDFTLPNDQGGEIALSDLRGGPVVVFFYPRDSTPGCTTEAREFSAAEAAFEALGAKVIGISKDSLASHQKFRTKQELSIVLLSDENGTACEDFGVWKEKKMYGKTFMGIERSTFLIDAKGNLAQEWRKVKVAGHVEQVLAATQELVDG